MEKSKKKTTNCVNPAFQVRECSAATFARRYCVTLLCQQSGKEGSLSVTVECSQKVLHFVVNLIFANVNVYIV